MVEKEIYDIIESYHRRIDKKYVDDPTYVLRKRVANTSGDVIQKISHIDFDKLTLDMYMICNDVGFKFFSEKYRGFDTANARRLLSAF